MAKTIFRGEIFHLTRNPRNGGECQQHFPDGAMVVVDGKIAALDAAARLLGPGAESAPVLAIPAGAMIMPGFIDAHIHMPQLGIVGSDGGQLLDWLRLHAYPAEERCADPAEAGRVAENFIIELLRHGTTCAAVYAARHPVSVDALFAAALERGMCLAAGKTMYDRNAPEGISLDTPAAALDESRRLAARWHGRGRLRYAVTPRFAPACSPAMLRAAASLLAEFPEALLQTHVAENRREVAWVAELFPERRGYLDVYEHFGLLGGRTILGHCLQFDEADFVRAREAGAVLCPCPPSNMFLGSGLFDFDTARRVGNRLAIGSDMGAGNTMSMLRTMEAAYKTAALRGSRLDVFEAFHLATLGNAAALGVENSVGNLAPGKDADFIVVDPRGTPLLRQRVRDDTPLAEKLFALMVLGDDRAIRETRVAGIVRHSA